MQKTTIDTHTLEDIPEEHRSHVKIYTAPDGLWTKKDSDLGLIDSDKSVGDIREPSHVRYTVTFSNKSSYEYE